MLKNIYASRILETFTHPPRFLHFLYARFKRVVSLSAATAHPHWVLYREML